MVRCTNFANVRSQESQTKIEKGVNNIKSSEEYTEFIERNKTSPPKPLVFKFDSSLLDQDTMPGLKANEIVVDDCTLEILKSRLRDSEADLKE